MSRALRFIETLEYLSQFVTPPDTETCSEPMSMDQIEIYLYLGSRLAATTISNVKKHKITHILSISDGSLDPLFPENQQPDVAVKYVELSDSPEEDFIGYLDETYDFINSGVVKGRVLVQCSTRRSRSAAFVIAYVMKRKKISVEKAVDFVKKKRRIICPNLAFIIQLKLYEKTNYILDPATAKLKKFRLSITLFKVLKFHTLPERSKNLIRPDPVDDKTQSKFICKKCKQILALKSQQLTQDCPKCRNFVEPISWMGVDKEIQGKLYCPKCQSEVGFFNWAANINCFCDTRLVPRFCLRPTLVDFIEVKNY